METGANPPCNGLLRERTEAVDALVAPRFPHEAGLLLLAVGGYGRRELFPHSDVDLLILGRTEERVAQTRERIARFVQSMWDAGLRVSQAVHTLADCATVQKGNAERTVSLLDARFLAGDGSLFHSFEERFDSMIRKRAGEIELELARLTRERHRRFGNTIYQLEPNLKDGPGGLRDYHLVRWIDLLTKQHLAERLAEPALEIMQLRCDLHVSSHRDNNVLRFTDQELLEPDPRSRMASYFSAARAILRSATEIVESIEERGSPLFARRRDRSSRLSNADFTVVNGRVFFRQPSQGPSDPETVLRLFVFVARHGTPLSADARRRLERALPDLQRGFCDRAIWREWVELVEQGYAALALREMHESGVLGAIFPEWRTVESLVIRDFYHQYTVDEHTLVAIESALALRSGEDPFAALARETSGFPMLAIALLFHDTGKAEGGEQHALSSVGLARPALERIGVPPQDQETILFLIEAHLEMSQMSTGRDLSDPATAEAVALRTGSVERLKLLTILTYADISAVHAHAMTAWRAGLLWQLYTAAERQLTRELASNRITLAEGDAFLLGLPARYLRTHSEADLARHRDLAQSEGPAVELRRLNGAWALTVVACDRPFLFASVAGVLSSFGFNILKAEAFSNAERILVDEFYFADPVRTLELNPSEAERLADLVRRSAQGDLDVERLLAKRVSPKLPGGVKGSVRLSESASSTLIEIVAEDRERLLYDLASAISNAGCEIETVLINTEARRAIDVFYVTYHCGKLSPGIADALRLDLQQICGIPAKPTTVGN